MNTDRKRKQIKPRDNDDDNDNDDGEEQKPQPTSEEEDSGDHSNSDEEEDDELLAAAAAWADKKVDDDTDTRQNTASSSDLTPKDLSLHITQLPYDANELDLRRLFAEKGCALSSIRLVYDRDGDGRRTVFRGVAFVDFVNESSYEKALSLDRKSSIRGRKLNIRPTRSKQELADIVSRTREQVQEKIKIQRDATNAKQQDGVTKPSNSSSKAKKKEKKRAKKEKAKVANTKSKPHAKHTKSSEGEKEGTDKKGQERKLTKKERNRRAAIIMGSKRGKKG